MPDNQQKSPNMQRTKKKYTHNEEKMNQLTIIEPEMTQKVEVIRKDLEIFIAAVNVLNG